MNEPILKVEGLTISFATEFGRIRVVEDVSFNVRLGQTLGVVGESGCGKSVTAMSIMRLLPSPPSRVDAGAIYYTDRNLLSLNTAEMRKIRGDRIGMIFQEPMTSLNPTFTIGYQLYEVLHLHRGHDRRRAARRSVELLDMVGVGSPRTRLNQYPHQLSGGLRQRVMIAMALACKPNLLIADEPTTALDVTIQAQILDLLMRLQKELKMSVIMITHDLGVVAEFCDRVAVMYAGKIVEKGSAASIFNNPRHPYTRGLLTSIPQIGKRQQVLPTIPGMVPSPDKRPSGCYFVDRCGRSTRVCREQSPELGEQTHSYACWNPYED
ncbi:MAG: ABC transporter ATP-binding protein [Desulfobacteraceae bacterium]|nr:ABC transporter ATP-binding protein [Desulfobacteraceae bacterium]